MGQASLHKCTNIYKDRQADDAGCCPNHCTQWTHVPARMALNSTTRRTKLIVFTDTFFNVKLIDHSLPQKDAVVLDGHQERIATVVIRSILEKVHEYATE